jgi:hypothetical protein
MSIPDYTGEDLYNMWLENMSIQEIADRAGLEPDYVIEVIRDEEERNTDEEGCAICGLGPSTAVCCGATLS